MHTTFVCVVVCAHVSSYVRASCVSLSNGIEVKQSVLSLHVSGNVLTSRHYIKGSVKDT